MTCELVGRQFVRGVILKLLAWAELLLPTTDTVRSTVRRMVDLRHHLLYSKRGQAVTCKLLGRQFVRGVILTLPAWAELLMPATYTAMRMAI